MTGLLGLIADLKQAKDAGKSDADLATARYLQRRAQFYLDFVEAENSTGFHAPQEAARILAKSVNYARQGQLALRDKDFKPTVPIYDLPPPAHRLRPRLRLPRHRRRASGCGTAQRWTHPARPSPGRAGLP